MSSTSSVSPAPARTGARPAAGAPQPAGELQRRPDVHAGQPAVPFRIQRLDIEQHEVDRLELGVGEPVAVIAVGVERV